MGRLRFVAILLAACLPVAADGKTKPKKKPKPKPKQEEVADAEPGVTRLGIASTGKGGLPSGASIVAGAWAVDADRKVLMAAPEPLLDAWLEFGPEIREKDATIEASGQAPGKGRLQSRLGVGLYGKNGFQLRYVPARQEVELVRRGAVLLRKPADAGTGKLHLELSATAERNHWIVSGRFWPNGEERPEKALLEYKIFASELEFPLAGRSVLFATPFSGEAVLFDSAMVALEGATDVAVKP